MDAIVADMSGEISKARECLERMNSLHQQYYYLRFIQLLERAPHMDFFFPFFENSWMARKLEESFPLTDGDKMLAGFPVFLYRLEFEPIRIRPVPPLYNTGVWNRQTVTIAGREMLYGLRNSIRGILGNYDEVLIGGPDFVPHRVWILASCHGDEGYPVFTEPLVQWEYGRDIDDDNESDDENDDNEIEVI